MAEFLPLCDVLFNVISLAGYFCDVVFDVVMGYALLERGYKGTFAAAISIVITSLLISQVISLRWYLAVWWRSEAPTTGAGAGAGGARRWPWAPLVLHALQLGVLWRYARLLVPVDLPSVKHQVRDLCMLRLVHAFCEAAPMLLLQLHVLFRAPPAPPADLPDVDEPAGNAAFEELNVISASLSLFSVCWALASFSKNVRRHNVHRLLLTWLGVIFQFLWRLGTVSARMCALTLYALVYEYWVFLVIGLHWVSMFLWLISPKNVFHGERISRGRKAALSALIAFVYVFAYVNLQELNHRQKMVTFYAVMVVENAVLVLAAWWAGPPAAAPAAHRVPPAPPPHAAPALFLAGLAFMLLYYRYFHVRRLGYMLGAGRGAGGGAGAAAGGAAPPLCKGKPAERAVPGVFNCRFSNPVNSAISNRKKKKPTSFVPPPAAAFWRRPLPAAAPAAPTAAPAAPSNSTAAAPPVHNHHGGSSENEGSSVGSRVNIQQKLQEKKQKQLAELRVIEEEIKQGKLARTAPAPDELYSSLQRQPIPRAKTHAEPPTWPPAWPPTWPTVDPTHPYQNYPPHTCNLYQTYTEIKPNYAVQNFQSDIPSELNDPLKLRRLNYENRTFYENPANIRNDVNRTPIRSPNYLLESRNYESTAGCPRTVLNNSPRNYAMNESTYDTNLDKPRLQNTIYPEERPGEYSGYCENGPNYTKYESKDAYVSALHNALANVQSMPIDGMRPYEACNYNQNCERMFPYGGKKTEVMRKLQRCRTPEILLAPHYLEGCNRQICCQWGPYTSRKKEEGGSSGSESAPDGAARDSPRPHSDIDSQISLPRSYTLPREFRYWRRRPRLRDAHLPSNNSSDGDVDSGGEDSGSSGARSAGEPSPAAAPPPALPPAPAERRARRIHARKQPAKPETKL